MNAQESHGQLIELCFVKPASLNKITLDIIITRREPKEEINIVTADLKIRQLKQWYVQNIVKKRR